MFSRDIMSVVRHALKMFDPKKHSIQFLYDTIELNQVMLSMLDEYSKGRVLKVETNKTRRVKKKSLEDIEEDDEYEQEYEDEKVERKFNFVGEFMNFCEYAIIDKYMLFLREPEHFEARPSLVKAVSTFLKRVYIQAK